MSRSLQKFIFSTLEARVSSNSNRYLWAEQQVILDGETWNQWPRREVFTYQACQNDPMRKVRERTLEIPSEWLSSFQTRPPASFFPSLQEIKPVFDIRH